MSASANSKSAFVDQTKIGEIAAQQPLSGVRSVDESGSVNGLSHAGFLRVVMPETTSADKSR